MVKAEAWLKQRFEALAIEPSCPEGFIPVLPHEDVAEDQDGKTLEESDLQGQSFVIEYRDAKGALSQRRITVRALCKSADGALCLQAVCWEKRALRSFRADRIVQMYRLSDKTSLGDPQRFLSQYLNGLAASADTPAWRAARPGLRVLLFLSRCDGEEHVAEKEVVEKYAATFQIPRTQVAAFLANQHPEPGLAKEMLAEALGNRLTAERLLSSAIRLIEADGILSAEEELGLDGLMRFSDSLRYSEDIGER